MVERWIEGSKNVAMVDEIAYPKGETRLSVPFSPG